MKKRLPYITGFMMLLIVEILIALFVHDGFIRPYMGDVIVVWGVYCFVKILFPQAGSYLTAIGVMLFAFFVEFLQYIHIVDILGIGNIKFFRVLIGTSFSPADLICYICGTAVIMLITSVYKKIRHR